jgi:hypothetical protein
MNKVLNELELNVGHYDSKLKGPIVWSWAPWRPHIKFRERNVGLGLQLGNLFYLNILSLNYTFAAHAMPVLPDVLAGAVATSKRTGRKLSDNHLGWVLVKNIMEARALKEGNQCWVRFAEMDDKAVVKLAQNSETLTRAWLEQKASNIRRAQLEY